MVEVAGLSRDIDLGSFRVSGLGGARLLVATCSLDLYPDVSTSDQIHTLKSQLGELKDEKDALETEIDILKGFGKAMATMPDLTPDSANSFSDTLFEKSLSNATAVRELDAKITELERQISKLGHARVGRADVKAIATIVAGEAGPAQLRLTYRESPAKTPSDTVSIRSFLGVRGARWGPLYDLYASSQDGMPSTSVSLHYRVFVLQDTGEDWNDAKLILSTSETDILDAGIPTSDGLVIEPKPKPLPVPRSLDPPRFAFGGPMFGVPVAASMYVDAEAEVSSESDNSMVVRRDYRIASPDSLADMLPEMLEGGAVISKTPMAVNYTVDELTTIPCNDQYHKVLVAIVPLEATISHITTPRKSPLAYLQVCLQPVSLSSISPSCGV